jgi:hypothetical protein
MRQHNMPERQLLELLGGTGTGVLMIPAARGVQNVGMTAVIGLASSSTLYAAAQ